MFEVRKGEQLLRFDGELLAESTSFIKNVNDKRWVEFKLYRTEKGNYVVSRVGMSMYFHQKNCPVVERNGIQPIPAQTLSINLVPCDRCRPSRNLDYELYPETPRYFGQAYPNARAVIDSLKKEDYNGVEYLTDVASRLLSIATRKDDDLLQEFSVEYVD